MTTALKLWIIVWEQDKSRDAYIVKSITPYHSGNPITHEWIISAVDELDAFNQFNRWSRERIIR